MLRRAVRYTYDAFDQLTKIENGTATSQSDTAINAITVTERVDAFYDVNFRTILENGSAALAAYAYDANGRRTSMTYDNGAVTDYAYERLSRLSSLTRNLSGTANDLTTTFSYNPASQISELTRSNDAYAWQDHYNVDRAYTVKWPQPSATAEALTAGFGGFSCAVNATVPGSVPPVTDIDKLYDVWQERFNSGDLEGLLDLYAEDVTYINPDGQLLYGRSKVREDFAGLLALNPQIILGNRQHVLYQDVALTTNHWRMNFHNEGDVK